MKSMISIRFYVIRPLCRPVRSVVRPVFVRSVVHSVVRPVFARSVVYSRRPTPIVWVSLHATIRACCHASAPDLSNSIVWVSFHATIRARCHASAPDLSNSIVWVSFHATIRAPAPDLLSAHLARILADRILIHGPPLLFLFFKFSHYAPELLPPNHHRFHIRTKLRDLALEREVL